MLALSLFGNHMFQVEASLNLQWFAILKDKHNLRFVCGCSEVCALQ